MNDSVSARSVECSELEARFGQAEAALQNELIALHQQIEAQTCAHEASLAALREEHATQAEAAAKELGKRSSLARTVIQEKEEELRLAQSRVRELTSEIQSGAPGERKIMALAESQAKRDLSLGLKRETSELSLHQLQLVLSTKDFELASLQQKFSGLQAEVLELRRGQRREGVSMDYLKNIIFKVGSFHLFYFF